MLLYLISHAAALCLIVCTWAALVWLGASFWLLTSDRSSRAAIRLLRGSVTALIIFGAATVVLGVIASAWDLFISTTRGT